MARIYGTRASDYLSGTSDDDVLRGFGGNDTLDGGTGADTMYGNKGNDLFIVDHPGDVVRGGAGVDTVHAFVDVFALGKGVENLVMEVAGTGIGNSGANVLTSAAAATPTEPAAQAPVGSEFQVNSTTAGDQDYSSIAGLVDGGFVVCWTSPGDGSGNGIYAQRYAANGEPVGNEILVNSHTADDQFLAKVTGLADGGFLVTWSSNFQDGDNWGNYAQRYDADGVAAGPEFLVNTTTAFGQFLPSAAALSDGGFVVSWMTFGIDSDSYNIYAQRYGADGNTVGAEFLVNSTIAGEQGDSWIAGLANGGFVVAWDSRGGDGSDYGVFARVYDANGVASGNEFQVNTTIDDTQALPSIAALAGGGFVVTWHSNGQDGSGEGVYARLFNDDGTPAGGEFQVNTFTANSQAAAAVTALTDGGFAVSWFSYNQDGSGYGIYAQQFDAAGQAVGDEFQVNTTTAGDQFNASIAGLADGGFAVTWSSSAQDGDGWGIFAQRFDGGSAGGGGETGANTLIGGLGDDTYNVQAEDEVTDVLDGLGGGKDLVNATLGDGQSFALGAGSGIEDLTLLSAGGGSIEGSGNELDNRITGAADASNHLSGGDGKDTLTGGNASDTLTGGTGDDVFRFGTASDDLVTDFQIKATGDGKDHLDLTDLSALQPGNHSLGWLLGHGYLTVDSSANVAGGDAHDTVVSWDVDGSAGSLSPAGVVTLLDVSLGTTGADASYWTV